MNVQKIYWLMLLPTELSYQFWLMNQKSPNKSVPTLLFYDTFSLVFHFWNLAWPSRSPFAIVFVHDRPWLCMNGWDNHGWKRSRKVGAMAMQEFQIWKNTIIRYLKKRLTHRGPLSMKSELTTSVNDVF